MTANFQGRRAAVAVVAACLAWAVASMPGRAEDWRLMGREGGCVTLDAAAARLPLLAGIATPDELVARLRRQGEEVHRRDIAQGDATAVLIEAPGLDLGLIFVPPSACR